MYRKACNWIIFSQELANLQQKILSLEVVTWLIKYFMLCKMYWSKVSILRTEIPRRWNWKSAAGCLALHVFCLHVMSLIFDEAWSEEVKELSREVDKLKKVLFFSCMLSILCSFLWSEGQYGKRQVECRLPQSVLYARLLDHFALNWFHLGLEECATNWGDGRCHSDETSFLV